MHFSIWSGDRSDQKEGIYTKDFLLYPKETSELVGTESKVSTPTYSETEAV